MIAGNPGIEEVRKNKKERRRRKKEGRRKEGEGEKEEQVECLLISDNIMLTQSTCPRSFYVY